MENDQNNRPEHDFKLIPARPVKLKKDYNFFIQNPIFKFFSFITVILVKIIVYYIYGIIFRGLRVKNRKNLKHLKNGRYILVCNHMHILDAIWLGTSIAPRRIYVTMLQSNLGLPVIGKLLRLAGGIPIPETKENMVNFLDELKQELSKNTPVLVMPEASIKPYHVGIRKFLSGAFRFAADSDAKILPFVYVYKQPKGLMKLIKKKPFVHLHVLEPVEVVEMETRNKTYVATKDKVHQIMSDYFNEHSDLKDPDYKK
ncbi:lysophospholipid acyltransferase family protein [Acholeplasma hippikon]|uniref:2-acyl-glycerophospho-ethanolamine acyltransferase n=1 Tax=Acholeplasma hippikon TaxID=264636 RepID=A0A449BJ00_9MOLU|nr:lysophospholipid acyltransferase family protein [Acholeplasma hippikon]VEU82297.1 2-acyl-glycerophospho-ethanolamine acyltransferase [Acholeplasma hippikon]